MNEPRSFRRSVATLTVASFSVAALMGIVALLGGGDFGEGEARVLLTTLVVGSASICLLCFLATSGTRWSPIGLLGSAVLVLPVVTALVLVWSDWSGDADGLLKAFGVGVVLAVTLAQLCLLLVLAGDGRRGWVLWPTVVVAAVVAVIVSVLIVGGIEADGIWRLLGVLAILDVLGTLVTIALAKFADRGPEPAGARGRPDGAVVRLSPDQAAAVEAVARRNGQSREQVVSDALAQYLAHHPAQ